MDLFKKSQFFTIIVNKLNSFARTWDVLNVAENVSNKLRVLKILKGSLKSQW